MSNAKWILGGDACVEQERHEFADSAQGFERAWTFKCKAELVLGVDDDGGEVVEESRGGCVPEVRGSGKKGEGKIGAVEVGGR